MDKYRYDAVRLVVGEPSAMVRQGLRTALNQFGFRNVSEFARLAGVREAVESGNVDLIVCDGDMADESGDVCAFFHGVRHRETSVHPFVVLITMVDTPTTEKVARIIDSGSDDLLAKPVSPGALFKRIEGLVDKRQEFVVTTDYIGPNRRAAPRPGSQEIPLIEVPNPLKARATGEPPAEALQQQIDQAAALINEQKMERHAFQIAYLVDRILPRYDSGAVDDETIALLDRLQYVSEDIGRRLKGTRFDHVGGLCQSMQTLATGMRQSPQDPDPKDIKLLPELSEAIHQAFVSGAGEADVARDISRSVDRRAGQ